MLSAPIPMPPIARPRMRYSSEEASVCMAEPMITTTTRYVDPNLGGCMFSSRCYCVVKKGTNVSKSQIDNERGRGGEMKLSTYHMLQKLNAGENSGL